VARVRYNVELELGPRLHGAALAGLQTAEFEDAPSSAPTQSSSAAVKRASVTYGGAGGDTHRADAVVPALHDGARDVAAGQVQH
jgi:hypothetical protein